MQEVVDRQRVVWQEQIDRVKEAEEKLMNLAKGILNMPVVINEETGQEKNEIVLNETQEIEVDIDYDRIDQYLKQRTTPVTIKPVSTYQKSKSPYLIEAEKFLREFKQRKLTKTTKPVVYEAQNQKSNDWEASRVNTYEGRSQYLVRAENILKNMKEAKYFPVTKPEQTNFPVAKPAVYQQEKVEKLDQNEIKDILIENINTKDGLKEIIKKLLKAKLE